MPIDDGERRGMRENLPPRKVVLGIGSRGDSGIRPRHPGMCGSAGVAKHRPLRQEIVVWPQRILGGPLHAESQLALSTRHVAARVRAIDAIQDRVVLYGRVRNRKAHFNAAGDKTEPGEYARRSDDVGRIQHFFAGSLMDDRSNPSAAVGTDRNPELGVLQNDEPVLLQYGSVGGFDKAQIRIDPVRIERRRDRTGGYQLMRDDVALHLRTRDACEDHLLRRPSLNASSIRRPLWTASVILV